MYYTYKPKDSESYTFDVNYARYDGGSSNLQPNRYTNPDGDVLRDDVDVISESESNDFLYKEQVAAAYLLYSHDIGSKVSIEAGVRGEYTFSDGRLQNVTGQDENTNLRNYFNLFPSLGVNYQINEKNSLSLNYGSRIERPAYQDLNPFEYLLDELSYWKGNPFLTPQISHLLGGI